MIDLKDVQRSYDGKMAVKGLSLQIPPGEVFAFLGPNGAGKTTTIKMLVGLLMPDAGTVSVGGHDIVTDPSAAKRTLGYVPDQPQLYDKLSGREFLKFVADMYGMGRSEAKVAMHQQAEAFEISDFWERLTESYSHGMKQRVAFAAALLHQPQVIILDEPMVGLDPRSMRLVKNLLRRQSQQGATVFMSTHTLAVAEEIADRIGVIHRGELLFLGTVEELEAQLAIRGDSLEQLFLKLTGGEVIDDQLIRSRRAMRSEETPRS
ncbi:MAG: ABC transporter ATP-binding protein [Pirellulaceae bacterium]